MKRLREYGSTLGTLGSSSAQTLMVAVFPVLLHPYAPSAIWIGFAIGGEGLFALAVPYWIGTASDKLPEHLARRVGRRSFFLILTAPLMALGLCAAPFLHGYWPLALAAFVFFAAFHGYLTPLWALMVDAVPPERRGRVHGVRGALHAAGLAFGLVGGGLLYSIWHALPFLLAAALVLTTTVLTVIAAHGAAAMEPGLPHERGAVADRTERKRVWHELLANPTIRWFLIANALWTAASDGLRPYIFLFAREVLGANPARTSLALALLVGGAGVGAVLLGRLGDRVGPARMLSWGLILLTVIAGMGVFIRDVGGAIGLLLLGGLGAAALIALPYPLFTTLVPAGDIGRYTGMYVLSLGLARVVAPVLVGGAIDIGRRYFPETGGYPAMWPITALFAALAWLALRRALPKETVASPVVHP